MIKIATFAKPQNDGAKSLRAVPLAPIKLTMADQDINDTPEEELEKDLNFELPDVNYQ